ncbi:hypothetical protein [Vibrio sp. 10N]|uniref:hypothetical protein n=1 Tax=Vibrio sp. 10N TaxID=3058938 RepID=UPI00281291C3|nr:hypothetical protein VB10N_22710 [Vibrio sp. 10N]
MKWIIAAGMGMLLMFSSASVAGYSSGKIGFLVDCAVDGKVTRMPMTACRQKGGEAR